MDPAPDTTTPEATKPETVKTVEPTRDAAPTTEVLAQPEPVGPPSPASPTSAVASTSIAPMPAGGPTVSSAPGATGGHAGEQSPKEADASSTTQTVEIRPGRPAAAQGLDITTKRPNFTRLVRATAYPERNPLLKVTFNRNGVVSKVVLVESSGLADVDQPVMNAVYQWTAKGKILAEISAADPAGGITVQVRILIR
jgi:outer membrane biosynthesis protein TonB